MKLPNSHHSTQESSTIKKYFGNDFNEISESDHKNRFNDNKKCARKCTPYVRHFMGRTKHPILQLLIILVMWYVME